jgi:hypothetical protein
MAVPIILLIGGVCVISHIIPLFGAVCGITPTILFVGAVCVIQWDPGNFRLFQEPQAGRSPSPMGPRKLLVFSGTTSRKLPVSNGTPETSGFVAQAERFPSPMGPRKLPVVSRTTSRQAPVPPQNIQIFMGKFGTVVGHKSGSPLLERSIEKNLSK